ncbi:MAG: signal peptidase I [Rhizobacter sp.]|nr:signal peptidase I [Burkholderiales bacterium]
MKYIPAALLAVLVVTALRGVFTGVPVNFPLLLLLAVVVCGFSWAIDKFYLAKRRVAGEVLHWGIEIPASIFTVLLVVFVLRSFLAEPFRIPSSSMRPGLVTGDFILVNKFSYGIRLPVLDAKVINTGSPQRGDVAVFKAPHEPDKDYIKRIVAVPGDTVVYKDKKLTLNGVPVPQVEDGTYSYMEFGQFLTTLKFKEKLGDREYLIAQFPQFPSFIPNQKYLSTPVPTCTDDGNAVSCTVPPGHYLAMGDNRDNSLDGRYWGFVPDTHLRGKAFFVWFNWEDVSSFAFKRVFRGIQ